MAIKTIVQSNVVGGNKESDRFLHTTAIPVDSLTEEVKQIIQDLKDTLWAYPFCIGLSAPQIGYPYAISIINLERESSESSQVLINPKIISLTGKKDRKRESCMSVWGKMGEVERRDKIVLEYRDESYNLREATYTGFASRAIQHEIDHLLGILYIDRMLSSSMLLHANFFDEYTIIKG